MKCAIFVAILGCIVMSAISEKPLCYDKFIPIINSIVIEAEKESAVCRNKTKILREETLAELLDDKMNLLSWIKEINDSFRTCECEDVLKCGECVSNEVYSARDTLSLMESKSIEIINFYRHNVESIDQDCHRNAVNLASSKSTNAFSTLTSCLLYDIDMPINMDDLY